MSIVIVRDKWIGSLDVLDAGTSRKAETGGVFESETFSSFLSVGVAGVGAMTSLILDLVKPAKLRALSPSQPLLLDGRVFWLTEELPPVVESERVLVLLRAKEEDFRLECRAEEEVSKVRVLDKDKSTAGLNVPAAGAVEAGGVCELETFSSFPSAGMLRVGTTLDLVKAA